MNTTAAALTVAGVLAVSLPAAYWQIRRAMRAESERDRIIRAAHNRATAAREVDELELLYNLPAYDPDLNAGLDRLRQAIRDEQQKGDQA